MSCLVRWWRLEGGGEIWSRSLEGTLIEIYILNNIGETVKVNKVFALIDG